MSFRIVYHTEWQSVKNEPRFFAANCLQGLRNNTILYSFYEIIIDKGIKM